MGTPEILIIEDEKGVQELIKNHLTIYGYTVHQAFNLNDANRILRQQHIDLICLDIHLPDGNGFEFCRKIKRELEIKIIILTKKAGVKDRVRSFEIGADDYLPKPFYPSELRARIKKQLDGISRSRQKLFLKSGRSIAVVDGIEVYLTTSQYLFLDALLSKALCSRADIARYISSKRKSKLSNPSLTVLSTRLRKKIKDETGKEVFKSHYSKGYRLVA